MKIDKEVIIGDVIQLDDEWYQCVECTNLSCKECDLKTNEYVCDVETPHCKGCDRSDNKEVFYKKLEKIGEPIEYSQGRMFQNLKSIDGHTCTNCDFIDIEGACRLENCAGCFYKEIKDNKKNMEIKSIVVPDGWECIVKNGIATFQEKKENTQNPPRTWEEFCENFPIQNGEAYIDYYNNGPDPIIEVSKSLGEKRNNRFWLISGEEAEAFIALMQLRQLRKAWVGDWEQPSSRISIAAIAYNINNTELVVEEDNYWDNMTLSFPSKEMAEDFLICFKDLCETAKNLL